jgi:hypothetical protein
LDPWISTVVRTGPLVGENELIDGAGAVSVNGADERWPLPSAVPKTIGPGQPPHGTVAWISVSESIVNWASGPLLNSIQVTAVRLEPWMSTLVPTGPLAGVNELIVGTGTVNEDALSPVPLPFVTEIGPVLALLGTVAWISESESTV